MRIVIGEDSALMREGLTRLLAELGHTIVAALENADDLVDAVWRLQPDIVLADIRMPPHNGDDGLLAAHRVRESNPSLPILILSNHVELRYAAQLLGEMPRGLGYLLKERVATVGALEDALQRLRRGECVVDPVIVQRVLGTSRGTGSLAGLSERELEVLQLMAEGASNRAVAQRLHITERTVEGHVSRIFVQLGLDEDRNANRRTVAVLRYLRDH
jgi:DNA-binding NarL/FixJ family response regulator